MFAIFCFAQQSQYSRIKIYASDAQLVQLAKAGIDITEGTLKRGEYLISELTSKDILKVSELDLAYEILIEDVSKFYVDRNEGKSFDVNDYKGVSEWEVPENFTFGSMSGHATFDEVVAHLDNMYSLFPDLITQKESIGQSIEGRDLWMVKISDNPTVNETEPEVLYTSLHHAREPAGLMTNLFFMYYVLENYESDPLIQTLVNNTELYFVLVINPDGYVYNEINNPNGGGMWRKNRRDNGNGSFGVDPNRNYGYMWGLDNTGSSPDPWDEDYRGTAPFSEPETQAIRDFCEAHEFKNAMNYHTHGNLLLYAWGYTPEPCEDDAVYFAHSVAYTIDNNYTYGAGSTTIYPTNGGSDDWMYGEQTSKPKILAYTPELGGGGDGFWCAIDRIVPIAQENMIMNILAAAFAGSYADLKETSQTLYSETSGYINYEITRLGLVDGGTYTVSLEPLSDIITSSAEQNIYTGMEILESFTDSIPFTLNIGTPTGTPFKFLLSVDNGEYVLSDTISKVFGETEEVYYNDCNTLDDWITPSWGISTSSFVSPTGSITDSPGSNYGNSSFGGVVLNDEIDLTETGFALLNFMAKWEIEEGYDYVQLMVSPNSGSSWEPIGGMYSVTGNGNQAPGQPVYDGFQTEWIEEEVDLTNYTGNFVTFRFVLKSDGSVTEDGFYFDDFKVTSVITSPVAVNELDPHSGIQLSAPRPNPSNHTVSFTYGLDSQDDPFDFSVYNAAGQKVFTQLINNNSGHINIQVNNWNAGIYYYRLENSYKQSKTGKLIVY